MALAVDFGYYFKLKYSQFKLIIFAKYEYSKSAIS